MFVLASAIPALPPSLQPEELTNTTLDFHSLKSSLTSKAKIFCIGADKTGTTTLNKLFKEMPGEWNPCHGKCPESWFQDEDKSSPTLKNHRAFMDNGDKANFKWLDENYEDARFVLNQRSLKAWMLSRFDMIVENRENGGCSRIGTLKDCKTGKLTKPKGEHTTFVENDEESMKGWIKEVAESQEKILKYFDHHDRKNRFVAINLCEAGPMSTLMRLFWAARKDTSEHTVKDLMTVKEDFPDKTHAKYKKLAEESPVSLGHENSRAHTDKSEKHIETFLKKHGCHSDQDSIWYMDCWKRIKKADEDAARSQ